MNRTGDSQAWSWPDSPGWRKASIKSEAGKRNEESLYTQLLKLPGYTVKWKKQGAEESKDWCWSWNSNFGHLMRRADLFEKTLILGKIEGRRRRGRQRMRWLDGITDSMDMNSNSGSWWWTGRPGVLQSTGSQKESDMTEWLNWTEDSK